MIEQDAHRIAGFVHVSKTGGMTVESLLRRNFGIRHLDVSSPYGVGEIYTRADMARDLRVLPFARSIAGHGLRPYVDYAEFEDRLVWYTWLREPVDRYISMYQHYVERKGGQAAFDEWMKRHISWNRQVCLLVGEADLEAAKQILGTKLRCFGLLERFNESLLLLRHHMGWKHFEVAYGRPRNPAKSGAVRRRIVDEFEKYRDEVLANNRLDQALYDYAVQVLYPKQVETYGAERLRRDLEAESSPRRRALGPRIRELESAAFRKLVHRPLIRGLGFLRRGRRTASGRR